MLKSLLLSVVMVMSSALVAQNVTDMSIGEWKLLLPYNEVKSVTHSADKVYFASKYSIVSKDKTDGSLTFYDLVTGLSETDIRMIKYDKTSKSLFVIYQNSHIDVLQDGQVIGLPIIKNKQIVGDKFIYDIFFEGNIAYLSCGFGLVGLNTSTWEVDFSTFTDKPVKGATIQNGELYASVTDGIYHIGKQAGRIQDFLFWMKLDALPIFSANLIGSLNGKLFFGANDRLLSYSLDNQVIDTIFQGQNQHIVKLTQEDEGLLVTFFCDGPGQWDDCNGRLIYVSPSGNVKEIKNPDTFRPIDAIQDGNEIWVGDQWYPYRKINLDGGHVDDFTINAPYSHRAFGTKVVDDTLFVVAGTWSPTKSFPFSVVADGLFYQDLKSGQWSYVNRVNHPVLKDSLADYNFMDLEINPTTKKKYIASFGGGIIELHNEQVKVFNKSNSSLRPEPGYDTRISVIDLAFDAGENLWATNYYASKPLSVLKPDGSWQSFNLGSNVATNRIVIDDYDNKWIVIVSKGLLVFNSGASLNDLSDDEYKVFTTTNSELQSITINDLAIDHDGSIWVATDQGVVVFECGSDVFGDFCKGSRRIASLDGFNAYLLDDEKVNAVVVDPANRKWFGTTNGIFVLSPSGEDVIATFNIGNSPLPNNDIQSLSIDKKTGTVYMGTSFGLMSYRNDAVEGGFVHKEDIYAYPNPVQPDYTGPIAIKGLAQNANVKITDVEGRLVFETTALGGQAIWDGRDYNQEKVESGVYLVFSTSEPGLSVDAAVAKIVIIN